MQEDAVHSNQKSTFWQVEIHGSFMQGPLRHFASVA
jgi:hypothetical protein